MASAWHRAGGILRCTAVAPSTLLIEPSLVAGTPVPHAGTAVALSCRPRTAHLGHCPLNANRGMTALEEMGEFSARANVESLSPAGSAATQCVLLAQRGVTGPAELFELNKGFIQSIAGPFAVDWGQEGLDRVERTIVKRYNAEIHSQTAIEAALELQDAHGFDATETEKVEVDVFDVAHRIIGGGEEGDKTLVFTKEDADHSLPYLIAVALLDHTVMPEQFAPQRLQREDVQALLCRVIVRPLAAYSARFPEEMPSSITVTLNDGRVVSRTLPDHPGFHTRPPTWEDAWRCSPRSSHRTSPM